MHIMKKKLGLLAMMTVLVGILTWYIFPSVFFEPLVNLNRKLSRLTEKTTQISGHTVHYLEGGQGETVVLLHGIFAEKDHWVEFARDLTPHYRVVIPDLPAFGESSRNESEVYDYANQVSRLAELLQKLGISKAHLAGSSMGGTIAALFAVENPQAVTSLAFIGAPHGIRSTKQSDMDRMIAEGRAALVASSPAEFDAMMQLLFAKQPFLPYPILHEAKSTALKNAVSNRRIWNQQLKDRYLLDGIVGKVSAPTGILWGAKDRIFDFSGMTTLREKLPAAKAELATEAGHLPMMEAPGQTAAWYKSFLASQKK